MRYGGNAPIEIVILQLAEKWHVPPWVVENHPDVLEWKAWQNALDHARAWSADLDRRK